MLYSENPKPENAEKLLSEPSETGASFTRVNSKYQNLSDKFKIDQNKKNFNRQFAHIYAERLLSLRKKVEESAKKRWGV